MIGSFEERAAAWLFARRKGTFMADLLARIKIPVKILGLLLMLGLVTLGVSLYGSRTLLAADDAYSVLVGTKLPLTTKLARASRFTTQMMYSSYRVVAFPGA